MLQVRVIMYANVNHTFKSNSRIVIVSRVLNIMVPMRRPRCSRAGWLHTFLISTKFDVELHHIIVDDDKLHILRTEWHHSPTSQRNSSKYYRGNQERMVYFRVTKKNDKSSSAPFHILLKPLQMMCSYISRLMRHAAPQKMLQRKNTF